VVAVAVATDGMVFAVVIHKVIELAVVATIKNYAVMVTDIRAIMGVVAIRVVAVVVVNNGVGNYSVPGCQIIYNLFIIKC
jgi:hypothetical protein